MADVRSMLRAERASRRITHPNASYTSDNKLICNLCEVTIKSETAWGAHLHSSQHSLRLHRAQEASAARAGTNNNSTTGKKRKASVLESPVADDKKRVRSGESVPMKSTARGVAEPTPKSAAPVTPMRTQNVSNSDNTEVPRDTPAPSTTDAIDEAEFEAFEREIAAMDEMNKKPLALRMEATISAAPISAEDLAAREQEAEKEGRSRRDAEIEAEKEDAARLLEEEFEEMEGLEERVRKLREKREALRKQVDIERNADSGSVLRNRDVEDPDPTKVGRRDPVINGSNDYDDDGDDDDDDDEFDDWRFGGS